ncbi:MAG: hypothetical protein MI975_04750 [Cytophagales bacterium]|nr:hypothetical protein [Cytophagales bacterium]
MKKTLIDKLCCPMDKKALQLRIFKKDDEEIIEGLFTCTECGRYYPVVHGLPIMTPDEYREKALEEPILNKWGIAPRHKDPKRFLLEG